MSRRNGSYRRSMWQPNTAQWQTLWQILISLLCQNDGTRFTRFTRRFGFQVVLRRARWAGSMRWVSTKPCAKERFERTGSVGPSTFVL